MMQATGIEEALGGEVQAVAALKAIGMSYERKLNSFKTEAPRMIPAAFTVVEDLGKWIAKRFHRKPHGVAS